MEEKRGTAIEERIEDIQRRSSLGHRRMRAIALSLMLSIVLLGLKWLTYHLTNSTAVFSDALESIVNVVASGFALVSIRTAAKPADPEHPYGHGKIEYFSAGFEGALIIGAAAGIFYNGIQQMMSPQPLPHLETGLLILAGATLINLVLGAYLVRVGRTTESAALVADGRHILSDVYSSGGVIVGLLLVYLTGWLRLDGAVACLVGLSILIMGGRLVVDSFKRLMDASDPKLLERIGRLLAAHRRPEWIDIHQLRAFRSGALINIDLHLVLPDNLLLSKAHHEAKLLEQMILAEFQGQASVLVHMDPCESVSCRVCNRRDCNAQDAVNTNPPPWDTPRMVRPSAELPDKEEK